MKLKTWPIIAVTLCGICNIATASSMDLSREVNSGDTAVLAPVERLALDSNELLSDAFGTALASVTSLRVDYAEHWQIYGARPSNLTDLGYTESDLKTELVEHVGFSGGTGAILIGLSDRFGDKEWAALIPQFDGYQLTSWVCQTTLDESSGSIPGCAYDIPYARVDRVFDPRVFFNSVLASAPVKLNYVEHYLQTGQAPTNVEEFIDPDLMESSYISHVMVDPHTKALLFGLDNAMYGFNQWISLVPIINRTGYISRWSCRTTVSTEIVNASGIRQCAADSKVEDMLYQVFARRR